jgi:DNA-binding response OmpR family regulator
MKRILVAEDEKSLAVALEDDLRLEGYEVEVVGDGQAAIERTNCTAPDLLILDVMLPRKDGFDVCRQLRKGGNTTPIILLTAKSEESDKIVGLELGADDYVTKPFSPRELRARIQAILRRTAPVRGARYAFDDIEIDFDRQEVRRAGASVSLTPLEFKLLSALIAARGRVLSREQLIATVWGEGTFITDRVIDTHMTNLRKKVEPAPNHPRYLVSIRGTGYRFDG